MADDQADPKLEEPVAETQEEPKEEKKEESPADKSVEEAQEETPEGQEEVPETPETPEIPEIPEEPAETQMSRRKAKRLEKLESLVERLKKPEPPAPKQQGINYSEMIEADAQTLQQLQAKSQEYGQAQYQAGLEQAKLVQFQTRLEIDAPKIESKYPQFNKESTEFNPAMANAVNEWYLATVGYNPATETVQNPNVRYGDFVEGIMELAENMAGVKTQKTVENIAKQAASTGLRPDGSSAKTLDLTKAPEDMTDEELNAAIASAMPRDARGRFTTQK